MVQLPVLGKYCFHHHRGLLKRFKGTGESWSLTLHEWIVLCI